MIVVADTSPLNYLILLGRIDLLEDMYERVIVPFGVRTELVRPEAPGVVRAWAEHPPSWVEVRRVDWLDDTLPALLGRGEREAISLSILLGADLLLIDERFGREEATARGLGVSGTLGILLEASSDGGFTFPDALAELIELGFRVSSSLAAILLDRYERSRKH